jgi:hypothetical protein
MKNSFNTGAYAPTTSDCYLITGYATGQDAIDALALSTALSYAARVRDHVYTSTVRLLDGSWDIMSYDYVSRRGRWEYANLISSIQRALPIFVADEVIYSTMIGMGTMLLCGDKRFLLASCAGKDFESKWADQLASSEDEYTLWLTTDGYDDKSITVPHSAIRREPSLRLWQPTVVHLELALDICTAIVGLLDSISTEDTIIRKAAQSYEQFIGLFEYYLDGKAE